MRHWERRALACLMGTLRMGRLFALLFAGWVEGGLRVSGPRRNSSF
jgi:hypothetical protein